MNIFESKNLNIDSSKAFKKLKWKSRLSIIESINLTVEWYENFKLKKNLFELSKQQIKNYFNF